MKKATVTIICDRCGKSGIDDKPFFLVVERIPDAAGSMNDLVDEIDLCPFCQHNVLADFFNQFDNAYRRDFIKTLSHRPLEQTR